MAPSNQALFNRPEMPQIPSDDKLGEQEDKLDGEEKFAGREACGLLTSPKQWQSHVQEEQVTTA